MKSSTPVLLEIEMHCMGSAFGMHGYHDSLGWLKVKTSSTWCLLMYSPFLA